MKTGWVEKTGYHPQSCRGSAVGSRRARCSPHAVQPLSHREAGRSIDETLFEGVPPHLELLLQEGTCAYLAYRLAQRVAATLRLRLTIGL